MKENQTGFTLVELVMVIVLLGILSVGVMSLFASRTGYSTFIAKDQFISTALLAQQTALATPDTVVLRVALNGVNWDISVIKNDVPIHQQAVERAGASLRINGVLLAGTVDFTFDQAANLTPRNNHNLVFDGDNDYTVCLSSAGFAYESNAGGCP